MSSTDLCDQTSEAYYRITVHGELSRIVMEYFEGMKIEIVKDKTGTIVTVLSGTVKDQGALIGILNMLYDFQYFIESVQYSRLN